MGRCNKVSHDNMPGLVAIIQKTGVPIGENLISAGICADKAVPNYLVVELEYADGHVETIHISEEEWRKVAKPHALTTMRYVPPTLTPPPEVPVIPQKPITLCFLAIFLPPAERADWMEENRGNLAELPTRRARWRWICSAAVGMPRLTYTLRTDHTKESA